jgi:hypothetical protein
MEHERTISVDVSQLRDLLAAADLGDEADTIRRRANTVAQSTESRPATIFANDTGQFKPLPSLPGHARRPDFHLALSHDAMRPRPRLDTTVNAMSVSSSVPALSPASIPPTPGLTAAFAASPQSAVSAGPKTPPLLFSTASPAAVAGSARILRSPSVLSMSPVDNPFQVRKMPPPIPTMPRAGALRSYTSMNNLNAQDASRTHKLEPLACDGVQRSHSQGDVLAALPEFGDKQGRECPRICISKHRSLIVSRAAPGRFLVAKSVVTLIYGCDTFSASACHDGQMGQLGRERQLGASCEVAKDRYGFVRLLYLLRQHQLSFYVYWVISLLGQGSDTVPFASHVSAQQHGAAVSASSVEELERLAAWHVDWKPER